MGQLTLEARERAFLALAELPSKLQDAVRGLHAATRSASLPLLREFRG